MRFLYSGRGREKMREVQWRARLSMLSRLQDGWMNGDGESVHSEALEKTEELMVLLSENDFSRPGIFPTEEGHVSVEWLDRNEACFITVQDTEIIVDVYADWEKKDPFVSSDPREVGYFLMRSRAAASSRPIISDR